MAESGFGSARCYLRYKDRAHISKRVIDQYNEADSIGEGYSYTSKFVPNMTKRYLAAPAIVDDILLTMYDVNSRSIAAFRVKNETTATAAKAAEFMKRLKRPNLEARIIGSQNGADLAGLYGLMKIVDDYKLPLFEADLFGNEIRHIVIDMSLGTTNNLLLKNRPYRPAEQINQKNSEAGSKAAPDFYGLTLVRSKDFYK
jgi:hypothetical protein